MPATIPADEPARLRAGDTWKWTRALADYPAGTWTLKYRFKHPTATGFEITATAVGVDHSVTVLAATSSGYAAGSYSWVAWVEAGAEVFTVDQGTVEIDPNYRSGAATAMLDDRSHARKTLAALEAWIERHDSAVAEYEIAGRRMKYIPVADLLKLLDRYRADVAKEDDAIRLANGLPSRRKLYVRFGN